VHDVRGRHYTGPDMQAWLVYDPMKIQNTEWQMLNDFCIHVQLCRCFLAEAKYEKGLVVFIRPKRICVCQSQAERVWLILITV